MVNKHQGNTANTLLTSSGSMGVLLSQLYTTMVPEVSKVAYKILYSTVTSHFMGKHTLE